MTTSSVHTLPRPAGPAPFSWPTGFARIPDAPWALSPSMSSVWAATPRRGRRGPDAGPRRRRDHRDQRHPPYYDLPDTLTSWTHILNPGGLALICSANMHNPDARPGDWIIDETVAKVNEIVAELVLGEPAHVRCPAPGSASPRTPARGVVHIFGR